MKNEPMEALNLEELMSYMIATIREISGCSRVSFISKREGNFFVMAGVPENQHGIGTALGDEHGGKFLGEVMEKKKMVFISHPREDKRTAYMERLLLTFGIDSVLFAPLYYNHIDIGIFAVDAVGAAEKHCLDANLRKLKEFIGFCAAVIGREIEIKKNHEKELEAVKEMEEFCALGKHTSGIAHVFFNKIQIIGGFAQRMIELAGKNFVAEHNSGHRELLESFSNKAKLIYKEIRKLEQFVNDIKIFSSINNSVKMRTGKINEFLKKEFKIVRDRCEDVKLILSVDRRLDKILVPFDPRYLAVVVEDIVNNAVQAGAKKILLKTKFEPEKRKIKIIIANDGEKIIPEDLKDIFSPFFTTKPNGTGLGLANVSAVVSAHGGTIEAASQDSKIGEKNQNSAFGTKFKILLPL